MNVVFRCDGNLEIGAGHLVRCSALAREITRRGGRAALVCRTIPKALRWATAGAAVVDLAARESGNRTGNGGGLGEDDLRPLLETARRWRADWIFIDHYGAGTDYLEAIVDAGYRLAALDDAERRDLRAARLAVNPNLGAESVGYAAGRGAQVCLGPAYAPLRREFTAARRRLSWTNVADKLLGQVEWVFVGFGGSRLGGLAAETASAIRAWDGAPEVSAGAGLDAAAMASAMSEAGLAISAAGSTVWELCCLGVPAVVWPLADNQRGIAAALDRAGAAVAVRGLGEALAAARELMHSPEQRAAIGKAAWELADGRGAERVVDEMERLICWRPIVKVPLHDADSMSGTGDALC